MQINFAFIDDQRNSFLEDFLTKKKFILNKIDKVKFIKGPVWVFVNFNSEESFVKRKMLTLGVENLDLTLFLPKKLHHFNLPQSFKKIF